MSQQPHQLLFANNYDMERARAGWRAGTYPAHHLFGTAELGCPFEVIDLPYVEDGPTARLTRSTRSKLGDIGPELAAMRRWRRHSVVYGASAYQLRGLAALRAIGAFPAPIVGVFHGVSSEGRLGGLVLRGFDRAVALSEHTRGRLIECGMSPDRISVLGWGPDLAFPGFAPIEPAAADAPVVATGKTGRDMRTLVAALSATDIPGRLYCERDTLSGIAVPQRVELLPPTPRQACSRGPLDYSHTIGDLRSAALVAIPLSVRSPLHGLTEVVDALACARPMILTRAPYFDFDIEAIGCGWWAEHEDVDGWSRLLAEAMSDRGRLERMGRAGRAWAAEHFNAESFATGLRSVLLELVSAGRTRDAA